MIRLRIGCDAIKAVRALREVELSDIKTDGEYTEVGIKRKDLHKAIAICDQRCYNYIITDSGHARLRRTLIVRLPLLVASVLAAAILFVTNAFVWRVEITGADGAAAQLVRAVLEREGARPGVLRSAVDERSAERALVALRGIAAASVRTEGSVIVAEVLPAPSYGGLAEYSDRLLSGYDCVITRVVADSGTPVVKEGDVVKKGDVLVEGKQYNTADGSEAGTVAVRGRAYGIVTFTFSSPVTEDGAPRRTGRSETHTSVGIFGLKAGASESPYEYYESSTERARLYPLPVEVVRTTYYELDRADFGEEAEQFAAEKADELLRTYGVPFEMRTSVKERGGVEVMTMYFTGEICVGEI